MGFSEAMEKFQEVSKGRNKPKRIEVYTILIVFIFINVGHIPKQGSALSLPILESRILRLVGLRRIKTGRYYEGEIKMQSLNYKSVQSNNPFNR